MKNEKLNTKKMVKAILCFSLLVIHFSLSYAQLHVVDSLRIALKTKHDDTSRVTNLNALSGALWRMDKYDTAIKYATSARVLAEKLNFPKGIVKAWRNTGSAYFNQGNYFKSLESYTKSLAISQRMGDSAGTALDLGGIARVQYIQGNYPNAMDYYLKALEINQKMGNKDGVASNYGNMANIYNAQANYDLAIEYHKKAIDIYTQTGNKNGIKRGLENISILYSDERKFPEALDYEFKALQVCRDMHSGKYIATAYNNMGEVYNKQGNYALAMIYYDSAINLNRQTGNMKSISINLVNEGEVFRRQGQYDKALEYTYKALAIRRQLGDKSNLAYAFDDIGEIYIKEKKYDIGRKYTDSSIMFSKAIGEKFLVKDGYHDLVDIDSGMGNYKAAFDDYKKYVAYSDSLLNDANTQKTVQAEMNYDFNQKQIAEKAEQDKKDILAEQERKKQALILYTFMAGFLLMIALAFFIYRGYRQKKKSNVIILKQKEEVEQQKAIVEEKNKEILDSINYAKRLQDAILPPMAFIKEHLPESFVLYKPKDIVAGDFYWMHKVEAKAPSRPSPLGKETESADYFTADPALYESLKERAELFRSQPTEAEAIAWHLLKSNSTGFHIRRQHIIGQYIVDFVNIQTKTVIEIDGDIHDYRKEEDVIRTRWLEKMGYEVIRFRNEEVTKDSEKFLQTIIDKLKSRQTQVSTAVNTTTQNSLPNGEGQGGAEGGAEDIIMIAACDCTGHGVPGALVSVVCSNALNRTVKEFGITDPGKILDKVRELVLETFEKSESNVQDGMDMSLATIRRTNSGIEIKWSGANNPLWYIQSGELKEINADKQPIGKYDLVKPFKTHTIQLPLPANSLLYLFTDGYADQFGGPKGKKYKYKTLQDKLLAIGHQPMDEQHSVLDQTLEEWRGGLEQVDDILIIGIKV